MLKSDYYTPPTELDLLVFNKLVPADHYLRQVKEVIDFEFVREKVKDCYSAKMGRTAVDPVLMFKLGYLQYHYGLSDREVLAEARVNVAYRYFLDLSIDSPLPSVGLLSQFRTRLGVKRYQELFDGIVAQGREYGLVKDRLRLKDATHVIANIAIPSTIQLVAQIRERLLQELERYDSQRVASERAKAAQIHQITKELKDQERLWQRVEHLRHIVSWADELQASDKDASQDMALEDVLAAAHKLLADQDDPKGKDRLRSATDTDARRGKHGDYYDGYLYDISLDPDSEIITAIDILPANGDEAANARTLIEAEQKAHGNRIKAISIDGIGFQGEVLRDLSNPEDLNLTVYVPPHSQGIQQTPYFKPQDFQFSADGTKLICPDGKETANRHRNSKDTAWVFRFKHEQCTACPLLKQCMAKLPANYGRSVTKNDYDAEYQAARQLAQTEDYAQVRRQHPKVERKLAEAIRYHGGRRARYRRRKRVKIQYLLIGVAINIKRIVRLLAQREQTPAQKPI